MSWKYKENIWKCEVIYRIAMPDVKKLMIDAVIKWYNPSTVVQIYQEAIGLQKQLLWNNFVMVSIKYIKNRGGQ